MSDEKDAREYLQALATKMTQELDYLRGIPSSGGGVLEQKNWRNRRSQKLDKMELLALQSSLQSEIQAKQAVAEELSQVRADMVAQHKELERLVYHGTRLLISGEVVPKGSIMDVDFISVPTDFGWSSPIKTRR